ncbi:MAG: IS110 family transposase, partial [Thermodesulfobacteriota bacterium]
MLYCGIDWAWEELTLMVLDEKGNSIKEDFKIQNSLDGFFFALSTIRLLCREQEIIFGIETSNHRIVDFLASYGYKLYLINPNSMDKFRKRYKTSGVKSDCLDAFVIANVLRTDLGTLKIITSKDELTEELGIVLRDRESLVELKTRLTNQLRACPESEFRASLREYFLQALKLFSDISCGGSLEFLEAFPTHEEALKGTKKQIESLLRRSKSYSHDKVQEIYEALREQQFPPSKAVIRAKRGLTLALISQIKPLIKQIEAYDKRINSLLEQHPDSQLFLSLPGVGNTLAAGMIALIGDERARFHSPRQIQALGGTAPITKSSGSYSHTQFRFSCNKDLRNTLSQ